MQFTTLFVAAFGATALARPSTRSNQCQTIPADETSFGVSRSSATEAATQVLQYKTGYSSTISSNINSNSSAVATHKRNDGAGPCVLYAKFPAGFAMAQNGTSQVSVYGLDGGAPGVPVGTIGPFNSTVVEDGVFTQDVMETINSFACQDVMTFGFAMANQKEAGGMSYTPTSDAGLFIMMGDCRV